MWINELKELYTEHWNMIGVTAPGDSRENLPPKETKDSLRMKGLFASSDSPSNPYNISSSSGNNPFEQEEELINIKLNYNDIISLIDDHINELDINNNIDKNIILHFGELKKQIKNLIDKSKI